MKKLLLLILSAALLLSIVPVFAAPTAQLNDLARYFPADTPIFIATRFDDAYFSTLDSLIDRVRDAVPTADIPPLTIEQALDMALGNLDSELSFQGDIRPWLGDTIAAGVMEFEGNNTGRLLRGRMNNDEPGAVAIAIKDRTAATSFITGQLESNNEQFTQTEEAGFTILTNPDNAEGVVMIGDDVLLITNVPSFVTDMSDSTLATNSEFTDAFARLPESDYNATVYVNFGDIMQRAMAEEPDFEAFSVPMRNLFNGIGAQAWGFTILDDVNFTIDVAQILGDMSALETLGLPDISSMTPIDPAFAVHIPAHAPLAIHSADLSRSLLGIFNLFGEDSPFFDAMGANADNLEEAQDALSNVEETFTRFTELDLREDVLSWMTGDYALFVALNPDANFNSMLGLMQSLPVDFGLAIEVTDPEAAAKTVAGLTTGIDRLGAMIAVGADEDEEVSLEITTETIVGTEVSVFTLQSAEMPWPVELLIGANGEVFALGTRNAVQSILARDGGLPSNAVYASAQSLLLDNTYSQFYLGLEGLLPLADLAESMARNNDDAEANAEAIRNLIGLIRGGLVSQSIDADGNAVTRLVLTLSE